MGLSGMGPKLPCDKIELRLHRSRLRQSHLRLATRLARKAAKVSVSFSENSIPRLPAAVESLLLLERLLSGRHKRRLAEKAKQADFAIYPAEGPAGLIIDMSSGSKIESSALSIRPLYDGVPDEAAIFASLLNGESPVIEIEQHSEHRILARGTPSLEGGRTINDFYDIVAESVEDLILQAIDGRSSPSSSDHRTSAYRLRGSQAPEYVFKVLISAAIRHIYRVCHFSPHWQIGWRFVSAADVLDRGNLEGEPWRTIPNPGLRFLADPFPIEWRGKKYLFAEDFDHLKGKGVISVIPFDANGPCSDPVPVLEEPWHLSYPFLYQDETGIWMAPESSEKRELNIYRATDFPNQWVKEATLLHDVSVADATILRHAGRFWMFATEFRSGRSTDSLSIFVADRLLGPWRPHLKNPVLLDVAAARSGGNVVVRDGRLWRPVQDCRTRYGGALGLAEIVELDEGSYCQTVRTELRPCAAWPGRRLHTLNRAGNLECIDGSANLPKSERFINPRREPAEFPTSTRLFNYSSPVASQTRRSSGKPRSM
jgi:hypothetical protein